MKLLFSKVLVAIGLIVFSGLAAAAPQLLPAPKMMKSEEGLMELGTKIHAFDGVYTEQAKALQEALKAVTGLALQAEAEAEAVGKSTIQLRHKESLGAQEYTLKTQGEITLEASTVTGMGHATATLLQLLEKSDDGKWALPQVQIKDSPDFPFRDFMVDLGRNPHSPETLRRVVDMLWLAKTNYLHLHLTDDQLFSWTSTAYPKLLSKRAGWTLADWQALETYSQARGVTIIPEFDVPGHSEILRKIYPEVFGKTATELATLESAYEGVTTVMTEMMSVFRSSPYMHIGGDEAFGVKEEYQRDFINRLNKFVKSQGRTTLAWEGPHPGKGKNKVDEDVILLNWRSIEFPPQEMLKAGHTIVNATWDPLYIVDHYPRTMFTAVPSEDCYNFNIKRFKHVNPDFGHYHKPIFLKRTDKVLGFCMPWWEGREENIFPVCRQRLNAVTARTWNDKGETSFESFLQRDVKLKSLLETIRPWKGKEPTGGWGDRVAEPAEGNLAHGKKVSVSGGASQPLFHPQRLTNGVTDRFDHFLGYQTKPEPLEITIDLGEVQSVGRVQVFEAALQGRSWEKYELSASEDGKKFKTIGKTEKGTRGDRNNVSFTVVPMKARYIRVSTHGCEDFTFPSFSRLCEVLVFAK